MGNNLKVYFMCDKKSRDDGYSNFELDIILDRDTKTAKASCKEESSYILYVGKQQEEAPYMWKFNEINGKDVFYIDDFIFICTYWYNKDRYIINGDLFIANDEWRTL